MRTNVVQRLIATQTLAIAAAVVLAPASPIRITLLNAAIAGPQSEQFDVASIRPRQSPLGRNEGGLRYTPGKVASDGGVTAQQLIAEAYHVTPYQVSGGPGWINSDVFEVEAKTSMPAAGCTGAVCAPTVEIRSMLQALLADRFHLSIRRETREIPIYVLVVGNNGPKPGLRRLKEGEGPAVSRAFQRTTATDFGGHAGGRALRLNGISMPLFAEAIGALSSADGLGPTLLGRPVLDRTNFQERYDATIAWRDDGDFIPALQDELGLTLRSARSAMEIIVIERVERPSAN